MASPITPSTGRALSLTPGTRVLQSPLTDETIWKKLKEAGFDEDSIKRRDKAALIAYIAKLEAEVFDLQHHMGLLILERKDLTSKYDQINASVEADGLRHKRNEAALQSAIAEAKKREERLKKALGVEKECISSMEKALHEMRAESAETKVAAECKLVEARNMMEDAQKKFIEAEAKLHAAESLQAEASRFHRSAERKLQEVKAREGDLSRHTSTFKTDCEAKEREIFLERQSLGERRKVLQQEHERLLDAQASLNQREDHIAMKSQQLNRLEKELEASKSYVEQELRALNDKKSKLDLTEASLSQKEEAVIEREALLNKREQEFLVLKEKIASNESVEIQKAIANHESVLRTRKSEFEAELQMKCKLVEDEIEAKRRAWELREVDLHQREDLLLEREHDLGVQSRILAEKEKDVTEKLNLLDEKERSLDAAEKDIALRSALLQQEKEKINKMKLDLEISLYALEEEKKQVDCAKQKIETMKNEARELSALENKLKDEVDIVRAQKLELMAEEDRLKVEKSKFEAEWELIDEKREELQKEAERVAEERQAVSRLLKDERDSLRLEKETLRDQHKRDVEFLNHEREEFMNKMAEERSEWFSKIQQEHADFLFNIEMQKKELENNIEKRREEVESYLRDKEQAFELEKKNEFQHISSLREKAMKEVEQVALEMKKLDTERMKMNLDREQSHGEWAVLNKSIEELEGQTQKLEKQRELLRAERDEISSQIEHLKNLEEFKLAWDNMKLAEMQHSSMESSHQKISAMRFLKQQTAVLNTDLGLHRRVDISNNGDVLDSRPLQKPNAASPSNSARFSWIRRCTERIFKSSPEKPPLMWQENQISDNEDTSLIVKSDHGQKFNSAEIFGKRQPMRYALGEPKVILEVPREGEIAKGMHAMESEIEEDASERITNSNSQQVVQAGRKRRVKYSSPDDCVDQLPEEKQINKKRKQQESAAVNLPEDAIDHCTTSTQGSLPDDVLATEGGEEDADIVMMDKVIKISEVTDEITGIDTANQEKLECLQNSEPMSDHNTIQDGRTNGRAKLIHLGNSVLQGGLEVSEMLKELVGNVGHGTQQIQAEEDSSEMIVEKSDNSGAAIENNIGHRTRSKLKM